MTTTLRSLSSLVLLMLGTLPAEQALTAAQGRHQAAAGQSEKFSAKLERGTKLAISNPNGSVTITGWDHDTVEAEADGDDGTEAIAARSVQESGSRKMVLEIRRRRGQADLHVKVPRYADIDPLDVRNGDLQVSGVEGAVKISSGHGDVRLSKVGAVEISRRNGDVVISDVSGSASVELSSGDLDVKQVKGNLVVKISSGDVNVSGVSGLADLTAASGDVAVSSAGEVRINAASGDIHVDCVRQAVQANTASGSVTLTRIDGNVVDATTATGDVSLTCAVKPDGRYRLHTVSGEVHMEIQPNPPGFTATIQSYRGEIITDFPLKLQSPSTSISKRLIGVFGDGKAQIALDTFSGTARLGKAAGPVKGCN
ncbi:MAG TPA: DUF4097 family beta strand repeat-containing protein [Blastocatellia bacterium]|nr:DUF4097 family beta strand repeat-containing protein [Blastocatellia bacterium]